MLNVQHFEISQNNIFGKVIRGLFLNYLEDPGLSKVKHNWFLGPMGTSRNQKIMNMMGFRILP